MRRPGDIFTTAKSYKVKKDALPITPDQYAYPDVIWISKSGKEHLGIPTKSLKI